MEKTTGGAAFPDPGRAQSAKQREALTETGMTLRDYFAAKVMGAMFSDAMTITGIQQAAEKRGVAYEALVAGSAYEVADAMLAERAK